MLCVTQRLGPLEGSTSMARAGNYLNKLLNIKEFFDPNLAWILHAHLIITNCQPIKSYHAKLLGGDFTKERRRK
jgi:hypothetical protein